VVSSRDLIRAATRSVGMTPANILAGVPRPIDLRSDTVTKPSAAMRRAMSEAEVGDDWYGDDPTVNTLQDRAAEVTGKEAAIYVATGTMANQIALHAFTKSGRYVVCEATSHVGGTEVASAAAMSGVAFLRIPAPSRGQLSADLVTSALEPDPYDVDVIDLVALENTHQVGGGTVMPVDEVRAIHKAAADRGVPLYLDGARLFNACAASGADPSEYGAEVDALMIALSKGLGAPIGSVLCGDAGFVREARRLKILFGGAWRQAGIMAAAGLVALEEGPKRLPEDHANARRLAEGVAEVLPGAVDPDSVETNIVFVEVNRAGMDTWETIERLRDEGVLATTVRGKVRMLTHLDVSADDVDAAVEVWRRVARDTRGAAAGQEERAG
jgi:threonine aldolase